MLTRNKKKLKAQAVFEYIMLIVFVLSAFLIFQKYIARAISGRWKQVGDSFSDGQSFDPETTLECATFGAVHDTEDARFPETEVWYRVDCFDANCMTPCYHDPIDAPQCKACIMACQDPDCN
ncbi:MAG: hypothetical protein KJ736_06115 [Candidatus Omnitrophica bacterium]|nr:hypothetical protein [Candidatus Omnitrophota bacterium]